MAIDTVGASSAASTSSLAGSRVSIANNFDTFLSLLTTQLRNQNPLDPLDTNEFTQQLVQFTSVEQQLKTNEFLEALVNAGDSSAASRSAQNTEAINMIGKTIVAGSSVTDLKEGKATWTYTVADNAANAKITIRDAQHNVVYEANQPLPAGLGEFSWDGVDTQGTALPEGSYSISVDARRADGSLITVLTQTKGTVASVDLSGDQPVLVVGPSRIRLDSVLSVSAS